MALTVGDKAPEILGTDQNGNNIKLSDFAGKKLALYFYPKITHPAVRLRPAACVMDTNSFVLQDTRLLG